MGKVLVGGQDANLEQVRRGWSWHYKKFEREQEPSDRVSDRVARALLAMGKQGDIDPKSFRLFV